MKPRRRLVLAMALLLAVGAIAGCGDRATRCTPFHKGFPLCGL